MKSSPVRKRTNTHVKCQKKTKSPSYPLLVLSHNLEECSGPTHQAFLMIPSAWQWTPKIPFCQIFHHNLQTINSIATISSLDDMSKEDDSILVPFRFLIHGNVTFGYMSHIPSGCGLIQPCCVPLDRGKVLQCGICSQKPISLNQCWFKLG